MAKGLNHTTGGADDNDDLIEFIELDNADRFDISDTHFPLVQAHNFDVELEESSNVDMNDVVVNGVDDHNDDDADVDACDAADNDDEERLVDLSTALSLLEAPEKNDFSFMGAEDETDDQLHLVTYHHNNSSSNRSSGVVGAGADTDADVNVDAVSLLMPELGNATGLDCVNFVDYDEFNMCLNNILSENDDELEHGNDDDDVISADVGKHQIMQQDHHNHHQQWRDVNDVLSLVPLTNNNLGLSFQEFANESCVTDDSSSQLA